MIAKNCWKHVDKEQQVEYNGPSHQGTVKIVAIKTTPRCNSSEFLLFKIFTTSRLAHDDDTRRRKIDGIWEISPEKERTARASKQREQRPEDFRLTTGEMTIKCAPASHTCAEYSRAQPATGGDIYERGFISPGTSFTLTKKKSAYKRRCMCLYVCMYCSPIFARHRKPAVEPSCCCFYFRYYRGNLFSRQYWNCCWSVMFAKSIFFNLMLYKPKDD